ncbi:flagellar hook-length control protein FliK [Maioricimonas rarisocia]|uniref:flagellar hook-length control protein FliK n=1 Tax=Maioricimonas rarisocia TaxID=2528026 RepID=UPI0018D25C21|nr:flagellar hook-length control protein FliK [Maioricimonas rarisocia]
MSNGTADDVSRPVHTEETLATRLRHTEPAIKPASGKGSEESFELPEPLDGTESETKPGVLAGNSTQSDADGQSSDHRNAPFQDGTVGQTSSSVAGASQAVNENYQTVAEQVIAEPAIQRQVTEQVVASALERARIVQQEGQTRMELQLSPPELGRIRIEISRTERGLKMRVAAESPATAQLLRTNLGEIQSQLEAAEMPVESMDLFSGDVGGDSQSADHPSDRRSPFADVSRRYGLEDPPEADSPDVATPSGRIDVRA